MTVDDTPVVIETSGYVIPPTVQPRNFHYVTAHGKKGSHPGKPCADMMNAYQPTTMTMITKRGYLVAIIIFAIIILDQALKFWVKTNFYLGESLPIFSWFQLVFIENNGMAFGWELGSKLFLTLMRIVVVGLLIWYVWRIRNNHEAKTGYLVCLAMIIAGAAGNIFDCVFYGVIFNNPLPPEVAQLFPEGGGYGTLLHGRVVDMLYFPLCEWDWPSWLPVVGGEHFIFFRPIFNLADAAISVGLVLLILFYSKQISVVSVHEDKSGKDAEMTKSKENEER